MSTAKLELPHTDAFVQLSLLDGGSFVADLSRMHAGQTGTFRMYNWAFYISHQGRHVLWDLGLDQDRSYYTPLVDKLFLDNINHVGPSRTIVQQLSERGISARDIDTVLFSHAHFDHSRPISDVFPNARAYFGPGTRAACEPGHMKDANSQWDGRFFDPEDSTEDWDELQGHWKPFGSFEKALDYFGDGSFWVLDAPGHMAGNLAAAARLQCGEWVLLGSDCTWYLGKIWCVFANCAFSMLGCHSRDLLDEKQEIAEFPGPGTECVSLHTDMATAKETMAKIRRLEKDVGVHTALAHDALWMKNGTDQVLMSLLDDKMKAAAKEKIPYDEIP
ncbi:Lactamase-B domain containing protein [Pyrenophora tritici-repentis]|nr:Lactamase-B domain containing protein [Pyrenophora tritici-repentis]